MAEDLKDFALEKAEVLSGLLKELASSGQGYVRTQFGVDLGLKPELYQTWVILCTAAAALLLLLGVSWAAVCSGLLSGKKRGSPVTHGGSEPDKANFIKSTKPEEQRRKNKKKPTEKKAQSNGHPVTVAQEEVKVIESVSKLPPQIKAVKVQEVQEVQAPVQVKKNKKKPKPDVKPLKHVSTNDGKELDDGAWETKVSNREKRQQRKKEKGPEDSGGPGAVETPKPHVEAPVASAPLKKSRGNHDSQLSRATTKGDGARGAVSSTWREEPSVNGGGWSDMSLKLSGQMASMEKAKWSSLSSATHYRPQPEPQPWVQDSQAWSSIDGRIKTGPRPVSFSMLGLKSRDKLSNPSELQWENQPNVEDEWSGFNGLSAADPSSDWNAPVEHWGNYEEPEGYEVSAPRQRDQPVPNKVSDDENNPDDPSGGAKSKKRRKKKKTEEEAASDAQMASTVNSVTKGQEVPVLPTKKQNPSISSSQKKSEPTVEPPKPAQRKKVRRET